MSASNRLFQQHQPKADGGVYFRDRLESRRVKSGPVCHAGSMFGLSESRQGRVYDLHRRCPSGRLRGNTSPAAAHNPKPAPACTPRRQLLHESNSLAASPASKVKKNAPQASTHHDGRFSTGRSLKSGLPPTAVIERTSVDGSNVPIGGIPTPSFQPVSLFSIRHRDSAQAVVVNHLP